MLIPSQEKNERLKKQGNVPNSEVHSGLALFQGAEEGEERAPGTHCLYMCVIIAKATW